MPTQVDLWLPMFTLVYLCSLYSFLPMFTTVYSCLPINHCLIVFTYHYHSLVMLVYQRLHLFTHVKLCLPLHTCVCPCLPLFPRVDFGLQQLLIQVYLWLPMFTSIYHFYTCLPILFFGCLLAFTRVYQCLLVYIYVYSCLPVCHSLLMFNYVYWCFLTYVYACLLVLTYVYIFLALFTSVY